MEKLVYALILMSRKLHPYFQAHRIEVHTTYPLRQVLHKPESSERMLKWAMELGQFDLEYMPLDDKALVVLHPPYTEEFLEDFPHPWWILHVDEVVNNGGEGACIVLMSPEGHHLISAIHFKFYAMNNDTEYVALINGLKISLEMEVRNLIAKSDSELVVNQLLIGKLKEVRLECVPKEKNNNADALEKMGSQEAVLLGSIPLEIQEILSIPEVEVMQVDEAPKKTWMMPILDYIHKGALPEDKFKARRLRYQAARYVEDATNFVRACDRCQCFMNYSSMPATLLMPMVSPWRFSIWGVDLIGELPKAKGDVKYAVVAVDYFTKWAEAMPLTTITAKKIKEFIFNSIVCRFGIPYKLVSDNGKHFDSKELR
ncbi:uncharacterized protein LOC141719167 [Apium graveolens]|uniref:uncharacterized protein LOC141719167 n=1 Tax=Apium graveolens TaxID=4045 RepID=UPI003D79E4C4